MVGRAKSLAEYAKRIVALWHYYAQLAGSIWRRDGFFAPRSGHVLGRQKIPKRATCDNGIAVKYFACLPSISDLL
jgi:hypothetical protein